MKLYGIDFTSVPKSRKPITCLSCSLDGSLLHAIELITFKNYFYFESFLNSDGPWVAGIDFPFSLPRQFIENMNWSKSWSEYVENVKHLSRAEFREVLDDYKSDRAVGDKEHLRETDKIFGGVSPQKQYGVPVALMFYEGAQRLLDSSANIPYLRPNDDNRIIFESYPGYLARMLIGKTSYKSDTRKKQTSEKHRAREKLFRQLCSPGFTQRLGIKIEADPNLANDPSGDEIDALLCAVQAAYAWKHRKQNYGMPNDVDPLEGWIAGPTQILSG
jgi:hypothetical protein